MSKEIKKNDVLLRFDGNYANFLSNIKERLQTAQIRAALAANRELVQFYWQLGKDLIEQQQAFQWGAFFRAIFS